MNIRAIFGIACFAGTAVWAADQFQPLDVKPGMWESTMVSETSGRPPIPEESLAKMTPEMRAQVEAAAAKAYSGQPRTHTDRKCLTKEDLGKELNFGPESSGCKTTVLSSSGTRREARIQCSEHGMNTTGTLRFEAPNPETMKFSFDLASGDGKNTMNIHTSGTAHWLGAACEKKK